MTTDGFFTANDWNGELEPSSDRYVALHTKDRNWSSRANGHRESHALNLSLGRRSHWAAPDQPVIAGSWVPFPDDDFFEKPARYPTLKVPFDVLDVGSVDPLAFRKVAGEWQWPICIAEIGGGEV